MTISNINVDEALERVRQQLKEDQTVFPSLREAATVHADDTGVLCGGTEPRTDAAVLPWQ